MSDKRPTLNDVARLAGVSWATASRVVNASTTYRVSDKTRAQVLQAVSELGYRASVPARALRGKCTYQFGLAVKGLAFSFMPEVLEGMQSVANKLDYGCLLYTSYERADLEKHMLETLVSRHVDGIIWMPTAEQEPGIEQLIRSVPTVQLLYNSEIADLPSVMIDQELGGYLATKHLTDLGHTRIAYIRRPGIHWQYRVVGYQKALQEAGLPADPSLLIVTHSDDWGHLATAYEKLMAAPQPPTAIIAPSDMAAWGLIRIARHYGHDVPGHVSIIGYGNTLIADKTDVPLTTIDHPRREIGEQAMLMLAALMNGDEVADKVFVPSLEVRQSTCEP